MEAAVGLSTKQMELTLTRLKDRVKVATGGAVSMDAVVDDDYCYFHAQLRLCSGNAGRKVQGSSRSRPTAKSMCPL